MVLLFYLSSSVSPMPLSLHLSPTVYCLTVYTISPVLSISTLSLLFCPYALFLPLSLPLSLHLLFFSFSLNVHVVPVLLNIFSWFSQISCFVNLASLLTLTVSWNCETWKNRLLFLWNTQIISSQFCKIFVERHFVKNPKIGWGRGGYSWKPTLKYIINILKDPLFWFVSLCIFSSDTRLCSILFEYISIRTKFTIVFLLSLGLDYS